MLTSEQGGSLRAALTQGGQFGRIAKALRRIHSQYERDLAHEANMSVPAFHNHFKAVTHTSPIQYIKSILLHQARLLMFAAAIRRPARRLRKRLAVQSRVQAPFR